MVKLLNNFECKNLNLVLIDECVTHELGNFLKNRNLDAYVLTVSNNPVMKGMRDNQLMDFCNEYNTCLITRDIPFFKKYEGGKILLHKNTPWKTVFKDLRYYFSSIKKGYRYIILEVNI